SEFIRLKGDSKVNKNTCIGTCDDDDVRWLDIPMNDPAGVSVLQSGADVSEPTARLLEAENSPIAKILRQSCPFDPLENDAKISLGLFEDHVVNRWHIRVRQSRECLRLSAKSLFVGGRRLELEDRIENLDRDIAFQLDVPGAVDA